MNKSPLKKTYWFESSSYHIVDTFTYLRNSENRTETKKQVLNFAFNFLQPDISYGCTALITYKFLLQFPWITVPCDELYEASYVCQTISSHDSVLPDTTRKNYTCDDGFFIVNDTNTCFKVISINQSISFYDAQAICAAQNASLFIGDVRSRLDKKIHRYTTILNNNYLAYRRSYLMSEVQYFNIMFGEPLAHQYSLLPDMILVSKSRQFQISKFFLQLNESCYVMQKSALTGALGTDKGEVSPTGSWGVKCWSCSQTLDVSAVICQKSRELHLIHLCLQHHFNCDDGTCILLLYVCDYVPDCFDESDENNCGENQRSILFSNFFVTMPSLLSGAANGREVNLIPVHSICDGIYSETILNQERVVCYKNKVKHIDVVSLKTNQAKQQRRSNAVNFPNFKHMYDTEKAMCSQNIFSAKIVDSKHKMKSHNSKHFIVEEQCGNIPDVCSVSAYENQCVAKLLHSEFVCGHFSCPGMFKCDVDFCIYMSSVCDGHYDCPQGDDERVCPLTSCPGMLKCRGENRCVSKEEICDTHINCLYSMDDEIDCYTCPTYCECNGYNIVCILNNSLELMHNSGINHFKGLVLKGLQSNFTLDYIHFIGIVYLNASFLCIQKVSFSPERSIIRSFVLIADFQHNNLRNVDFLQSLIFQNILYLGLSFNKLISIIFNKEFLFQNLEVLILKGNPLHFYTFTLLLNGFEHGSKLHLIDISQIILYSEFQLNLPLYLYKEIKIKVSDPMMCCIISRNIKCISKNTKNICFGILQNNTIKYIFFCISIVTLLIASLLLTKLILFLSSRIRLGRKRKYLFVMLLNQSIAAIVTSFYLIGLSIADIRNVNLFFWRISYLCTSLNFLLYTSLECITIFKVSIVIIVSFQILYPFKHQCLWLRFAGPFSVAVWIFLSCTYSLHFVRSFQHDNIFNFDYLCSIGMCETKSISYALLRLACSIDIVTIASCCCVVCNTYFTLVRNKHNLNKIQSHIKHKMRNDLIVLKICIPLLTEIPFRIGLFCLLASPLHHILLTDTCKYVFLFVLPACIILSSLLFFIRTK